MNRFPRLYAIADASFGDPVRLARSLFDGGARLVQIRNKNACARELLDQVERVLAAAPHDARVLVNDRADVAQIAEAAGVHLGQTDLPPSSARRILGPDRIIGISTHNMEQAVKASREPVDYIAVGPIFATSTKENPDPVVGLERLSQISKVVQVPIVAIGGIRLETASDVIRAGAASVAVIRDLLAVPDVAARTGCWIEELGQAWYSPS
jgi:thiamine-phosphate pyrophosphorylase